MPYDLSPLIAQVTEATTVMGSAKTMIDGIAGAVAAAVTAALANGATSAELQPVVDVGNALKTQSDALQASIVANTPAAPPPVEPPATEGFRRR